MLDGLNRALEAAGKMYIVERKGIKVCECKGLPNNEGGNNYVDFLPSSDIKQDDWIIDPVNKRLFVVEVDTVFLHNEPFCIRATIMSEKEMARQNKSDATFYVHNAYGSIIGTQSHASINYNDYISKAREEIEKSESAEKQELSEIIELLEKIVNNEIAPKKGLFAKFSEAMERNSWITSSISSALLSWLLSNVK